MSGPIPGPPWPSKVDALRTILAEVEDLACRYCRGQKADLSGERPRRHTTCDRILKKVRSLRRRYDVTR